MQIVYLDFETYYHKENFSLKTAKSTGEYIGTTQVQMVGWAFGDGDVHLAVGEDEVRTALAKINWSQTALVSHNTQFDARLLMQRFGHTPAFFFDTLAMMRSLHWNTIFGGAKLGHLSKVLQAMGLSIEDKGSEIEETNGKYLFKFPNGQWYMNDQEITGDYLANLNITKSGKKKTGRAVKDPRVVVQNAIDLFGRFSSYCKQDVEICRLGFKEMLKQLPRDEIRFQDMITRCALFPQLEMDLTLLKGALTKATTGLSTAVKTVADKWYAGDEVAAKEALMSTAKLGSLLKVMGGMTQDEVDDYIATEGVHPEPPFIIPTKVSEKESLKAGRSVYKYALAKKDPGMVELASCDFPDLQEVLACRKTAVYYNNYEIPRLTRFINEQGYSGEVGMPLKVSGAFTHRLGGDVFNIQNLSSGRNEGQDAVMRKSIMAKDNRVTVAADSSQVEARVLAFEANEIIILDEFKSGVDPYCSLAEKIYNIPYDVINARRKNPEDPFFEEASLQRQAGKAGRLGLGYQMGPPAFVDYAATLGVQLSLAESKRIVDVYRTTYSRTKTFWDTCGEVLKQMVAGGSGYFGGPTGTLFYFDGTRKFAGKRIPGIMLPDGMWLTYTELQMRERTYEDGTKRWNFCYYGIKEGKPGWVWIYSGKVTENLTQALAFSIMKWQAMNINARYPIAFNVHDEWVTTTTADDAEACKEFMIQEMSRLPDWAQGCPIGAEGAYAKRYGDC